MSITIKLDSAALSALIDNDPAFKVDIQSAILANIAQKYIKGAGQEIESRLEAAAQNAKQRALEGFTKTVSSGDGFYKRNREVLCDSAGNELSKLMQDDLLARFPDIFNTIIDAPEMQTRINDMVERRLREASESMLRAELDKRISAARKAMMGECQ